MVVPEVILPPEEYTTECPYKEFTGTTEKELVQYVLHLQEELDKCNLKQTQEKKWFIELQSRMERMD